MLQRGYAGRRCGIRDACLCVQVHRHGFAVPVLCMAGAPLYTQHHVYPAPRQTPVHRR